MATKQIGPIQFQGKLDTLVGRSTRKGYMSIGMKAKKTTNPNTPKQVRARTEFACAQAYGNGIPSPILAGLRPYSRSIKASIRNAAAKLCYNPHIMETTPNMEGGYNSTIPVEKYFFSKGSETNVFANDTNIDTDTPLTVKVSWSNTGVKNDTALCHIILYNSSDKTFMHKIAPSADQEATFEVGSNWNGTDVHVYIYTQYPPRDPDGFKYFSEFSSASSDEREAIEARSTYSPTRYLGKKTVG